MNMTTSGLASPPRAAPPRVHSPAPTPPAPPRRPERSPPAFGRILGWSLGLSAFLHLLLLLVPEVTIRIDPAPGPLAPSASAAADGFGLEMVVPIPSASAPERPPVEEREEEPLVRPTQLPQVRVPSAGPPGGQAPPPETPQAARGDGGTVRDALGSGFSDSRLYIEPDEFPELRKTQHEQYMEHLQARIDAVNDSLGLAAARERRTSDWTYTDASGRKWGLSPDGLHLGDLTIDRKFLPLPAATGDNQSLEAERERLRMREEIQNQEAQRERDETSAERRESMREDADARRQNGDGE
jgi:hypothetical protein